MTTTTADSDTSDNDTSDNDVNSGTDRDGDVGVPIDSDVPVQVLRIVAGVSMVCIPIGVFLLGYSMAGISLYFESWSWSLLTDTGFILSAVALGLIGAVVVGGLDYYLGQNFVLPTVYLVTSSVAGVYAGVSIGPVESLVVQGAAVLFGGVISLFAVGALAVSVELFARDQSE